MARRIAEIAALLLVVAAVVALFEGVRALRAHDYVATVLLGLVAIPLVRTSAELLRPSIGE
ncbi:MAG: hypothetical protein IT379_00850 [Deltaproteobacteria bacterium]|nr:hypothetical protein [Deltaproteobacteria bacterium]